MTVAECMYWWYGAAWGGSVGILLMLGIAVLWRR